MDHVIYLDYDGLLHPDAVYRPRNRPLELRAPGELMMYAPILEEILLQCPHVRIVLSTSWVRELSFDRALKRLPAGLQVKVIGATWHKRMRKEDGFDPFSRMTRFRQLQQHVNRHLVRNWLAIDDLHSGTEEWIFGLEQRLVLTDGTKGLGCPSIQEDLKQKLQTLMGKK